MVGMHFDFGFVVVERFGDGHFEEEKVFGSGCFEEEVEFGRIQKHIGDFGRLDL